jgi:hypothetical protein
MIPRTSRLTLLPDLEAFEQIFEAESTRADAQRSPSDAEGAVMACGLAAVPDCSPRELRELLLAAGFRPVVPRDIALSRALNRGYLFRLDLEVRMGNTNDPRLGAELGAGASAWDSDLSAGVEGAADPSASDGAIDGAGAREEESRIYGGGAVLWCRGYGREVSSGRLLLAKIDYLQTAFVRKLAAVPARAALRASEAVERRAREVRQAVDRSAHLAIAALARRASSWRDRANDEVDDAGAREQDTGAVDDEAWRDEAHEAGSSAQPRPPAKGTGTAQRNGRSASLGQRPGARGMLRLRLLPFGRYGAWQALGSGEDVLQPFLARDSATGGDRSARATKAWRRAGAELGGDEGGAQAAFALERACIVVERISLVNVFRLNQQRSRERHRERQGRNRSRGGRSARADNAGLCAERGAAQDEGATEGATPVSPGEHMAFAASLREIAALAAQLVASSLPGQLISALLARTELREPTFAQLVEIHRPTPASVAPTPAVGSPAAAAAAAATLLPATQLAWQSGEGPSPPPPPPPPCELSVFHNVPIANCEVVLPGCRLSFGAADALRFDLLTIGSLCLLLANLRAEEPFAPPLPLAAISLAPWLLRTALSYRNSRNRYELARNRFLNERLLARGENALRLLRAQAAAQRARRAALVLSWLHGREGEGERTDGIAVDVLTLERERAAMLARLCCDAHPEPEGDTREATRLGSANFDVRATLADLERLGLAHIGTEGAIAAVADESEVPARLRAYWDGLLRTVRDQARGLHA